MAWPSADQGRFGSSVSLTGSRLLIGAESWGPPFCSGKAFVFEQSSSGAWRQAAQLLASDAGYEALLGRSVALSSEHAIAGATGDDEAGLFAGAAYLFDAGLGKTYCESLVNSTGAPAILSAVGSASLAANELMLEAWPVPASTLGTILLGLTPVHLPFGDGIRCVAGHILRSPPAVAKSNVFASRLDLSSPPFTDIVAGSTWHSQAWFRDIAARGALFNTSSALSILFEN